MSDFSDRFVKKVSGFITGGQLLGAGAPVVVALSGGADSVALLSVLSALGYDCCAAHCNFHLRGEESMRDMRHCVEICRALGVELLIEDFDVPGYRNVHDGSVEMACRELRYRWFDQLLDSRKAQAIAVGHHAEDRVETFMLNLVRGTGISGLTALRPRSGRVVRPLLSCTRDEIERYLADVGLTYITDSSNNSDVHRRNRLRNNILPSLEDAFPGAMDAIVRTIANLEKTETVYRMAVDSMSSRYISWRGRTMCVDLEALVENDNSEALLYELLSPRGFTAAQVADIISRHSESGRTFISAGGMYTAELDRGVLSVMTSAEAVADDNVFEVDLTHDIAEPVAIEVSFHPAEEFRPENTGGRIACFDAAAADGAHRWELRHPRRGDRMVPFGSKRSKLLSDIFNNAKLSAAAKRDQWVLTCDGEIVWLPGLRNSARWRINTDTKQYVRLYLKNNT